MNIFHLPDDGKRKAVVQQVNQFDRNISSKLIVCKAGQLPAKMGQSALCGLAHRKNKGIILNQLLIVPVNKIELF